MTARSTRCRSAPGTTRRRCRCPDSVAAGADVHGQRRPCACRRMRATATDVTAALNAARRLDGRARQPAVGGEDRAARRVGDVHAGRSRRRPASCRRRRRSPPSCTLHAAGQAATTRDERIVGCVPPPPPAGTDARQRPAVPVGDQRLGTGRARHERRRAGRRRRPPDHHRRRHLREGPRHELAERRRRSTSAATAPGSPRASAWTTRPAARAR